MGSRKSSAASADRERAMASMGPRRWGRGRESKLARLAASLARLQWGRDDGVAEEVAVAVAIGTPPYASMGPRRWGAEEMPLAVARRRVPVVASMGPRRWGRGREDETDDRNRHSSGFNGAATMGSRKSTPSCLGRPRKAWLQWGRDDGVAEEQAMAYISGNPRRASMGPRRWGRGRVLLQSV